MKKAAKNPFSKAKASAKAGLGNMKVYSSLAYGKMRHTSATKKAASNSSGKKLAPLPKDPWKRFLAHFRWERIKAYWFSKAGLRRIGS